MSIVRSHARTLVHRAAVLAAAAAFSAALTSCGLFGFFGGKSSSTSTSAPDTTPPKTSGAVTSSMSGADTVHLTWTAASDDSTSTANIKYEIVDSSSPITTVNGAKNDTVKLAWTPGITSADVTVSKWDTSGNFHYFAVLAKDAAGNISLYADNAKRQVDLYDVVAVTSSGTQVFYNNGNGVLTPDGSVHAGADTSGTFTSLALGNIDGHLAPSDGGPAIDDIFVTKNGGINQVWTNNGDTTFTERTDEPFTTDNSTGVALGDITGSGYLDAFVANFGVASTLWTNTGSGTYQAGSATNIGGIKKDLTNLAIGSLNTVSGSTGADVLTTVETTSPVSGANNIAWIDGTNASAPPTSGGSVGTYQAFAQTGATNISQAAAIADLTGDGINDVFVANNGINTVWKNSGDWSSGNALTKISEPAFSSLTNDSTAVALGDLNGDGTIDAFVVNSGSPDTVWSNDGSGVFSTFTTPNVSAVTEQGTGVALADLNGDGILDAVVSSGGSSGTIRVWLGKGDGSFTQVSETKVPNADYVAVAVGRLR